MTDVTEATASIGHNKPPADDPFEAHAVNISDLYDEAAHWLDGEPIADEGQAEGVQKLLDLLREAKDAADASRIAENKPFDEGKAAVQAKYAPLIGDTKSLKGKAVRAIEICRDVLAAWRRAEQKRLDAIAEQKRVEAQVQAAAALEAAQSAAGDLSASEAAGDMISQAQAALRDASIAGKAHVKGLRDYWVVKGCSDPQALSRHYWTTNRDAVVSAMLELARQDVQRGKRVIPGVLIENEPRAV